MDCESAGKMHRLNVNNSLLKLNFIICLHEKMNCCLGKSSHGRAAQVAPLIDRSGQNLGLGMETGRRAGQMEGCDEFARRGRCILRLMPTLYVRRYELHARNSLCNGQVAGVTDAAAIGVGRSIVVMDLFGDGGSGLQTGKKGQQE
jgi:hypothetical protein